jgi:hypothetical protein
LEYLETSEFLEITFKNARVLGTIFFDAGSFFFQKTKISIEICQRQED